ncbi:hypothetical protein [Ensifer sp. ENS12]|uniref:hypothetical protein n=1 Tax=Ensifer sp. ENS12 TaxID=2854774 RepID=UPI001C4516EC|nr:hypothetical protein [Ensifer sp. ENS12]MBV7522591.1 hypothetical protein [Ensifer sp. ENS12]
MRIGEIYDLLKGLTLDVPKAFRQFAGPQSQVTHFINALAQRIAYCGAETLNQVEQGHWLAASLFARANIEAVALLDRFACDLDPRTPRKDALQKITRYVFAAKAFDGGGVVHINDCLRPVFRDDPRLEQNYNLLCEAVHPNWLGVSKLGGEIDAKVEAHLRELMVECSRSCGVRTLRIVQEHFEIVPVVENR